MTIRREIPEKRDTIALAKSIVPQLKAGDVIFLYGGLGSGKTFFVKQIGKFLGIDEAIDSPSFVLLKEYRSGRIPLFHFDLFRLKNEREVIDLGILDVLDSGITCIEWPELASTFITHPSLVLRFDYDGIQRTVIVE
ncbi:MAG: tRNA (adenosine(37)-N6)-threonylcarbamoyltransferase complex ATPase subunit type 1 TsaE [Candidatus Cloacimonetes bacterium]|nr:tRNA (adenosine(37)-N6)-threonylcarbamoyltransferase complex ATPase subunit type 1 TsaE [Candidatus Cloacimonadota bacterium]